MWPLALRLFLQNSVLSSSRTNDAFPNSDKEDTLAHLHLHCSSSNDEGLVGTDLGFYLAAERRPGCPG